MAHIPSGEWDYVGDAQIIKLLEENRLAYASGDKSQLMLCVFRCAAFQAVIPEWAADALIELRENIECGRVRNFNEAFGKPATAVNTRASSSRIRKVTPDVVHELLRLRLLGTPLNDADMFPQVVENLRNRGIHVNHRDVQKIYKRDGGFLKAVSRNPDPSHVYGTSMVTLPRPRRHGRSVLRD